MRISAFLLGFAFAQQDYSYGDYYYGEYGTEAPATSARPRVGTAEPTTVEASTTEIPATTVQSTTEVPATAAPEAEIAMDAVEITEEPEEVEEIGFDARSVIMHLSFSNSYLEWPTPSPNKGTHLFMLMPSTTWPLSFKL